MAAKIFKILFRVVIWCIAIAAIALAVLRSETFQQWALVKATDYLSKELKTKVTVAGFGVKNVTQLYIDSICIEDRRHDTAFYIRKFTVDLDRLDWDFTDKENRIDIKYAAIDGAYINFRQYDTTEDWNYEFIINYFNKKDTTDTIPGPGFVLNVGSLQLTNSAFAMRSPHEEDSAYNHIFNPSDFKFQELSGTFNKFSIVDDSLAFKAKNLTMTEPKGFKVKNLTADTRIYSGGLEFSDLLLETEKSRLAHLLKMNYNGWDDMKEFVTTVVFTADIRNSRVDMEDVAFWGENMENLHQVLDIQGQVRGTIANLKGKNIEVRTGTETFLAADFSMKGLPDFTTTFLDVKIDEVHTRESDIKQLFDIDDLPPGIKKLGAINFTGNFTGFPTAFVAYGRFTTDLGKLASDIKMDFSSGDSTATYSGVLKAENFNLGEFVDAAPTVGHISFNAKIEGQGLSMETIDAVVQGKINAITVNQYEYKNIEMDGNYAGKFFNGEVRIRDANLELDFDGNIDFTSKVPQMDFVSTIYKADLQALKFDTVSSSLAGKLYLNFSGSNIDELRGRASFAQILLRRNARIFKLDTASITSGYTGSQRSLKLYSNIVDAEITGEYHLSELPRAINNYAASLLPHIIKEDTLRNNRENFSFKINVKRPQVVTAFLWDDITAEPFEAFGSINTAANEVKLVARAPRFRYSNVEFKGISLTTPPNSENGQSLVLALSEFYMDDSLYVANANVSLIFKNQDVLFDINVPQNIARLGLNLKGRLEMTDDLYRLVFEGSGLVSTKRTWRITDDSYVAYQPKTDKFLFHGVEVSNGDESLRLNGILGNDFNDTLRLDFKDFNLANVNYFTRPAPEQELGGVLNGNIVLFNIFDVLLFTSALKADTLALGQDTLGNLVLNSTINNINKIITVAGGFTTGRLQGSKLGGTVNLDRRTKENFNVEFKLNNATTRLIEPFVVDIASSFTGTFSTNITLKGSFSDPVMGGSVAFSQASFVVDYLQTRYSFDTARIVVTKNRFTIESFILKDEKGAEANAAGYIAHKEFSDFRIDFSVKNMRSFMALNTTSADNDLYFGTAFMTGNFNISGSFDNLLMQVNARSEKGTVFNLMFADEGSVGSYDFITFIDYNAKPVTETVDLKGIRLNLNLQVTTDADIKIIFDSQLGDIIEGKGNANLRMEINTLGDFKMFGTFEIEKGKYLFTALDFINRNFTINKGGTITWTGDPLKAKINLQAVYTVNTSPQPLVMGVVPESDLSKYSGAVPVQAIMFLSGELLKPDIRFGISIPDLSRFNGSSVNTSVLLNTIRRIERDQEEVSRQVFSLLALGSFTVPAENGYVAGASDNSGPGFGAVTNSVGNLLSNQITNWLSKYDPKWNIGVQVGQGSSAQARTELILSVSRMWLNDKLQVDVSIDPYTTQGNVNANYKLVPSGNYQVRAFSRNANNPIYNQNIFSFGGGFYIRSEFEDMAELKQRMKDWFKKKGKKATTN